MTDELNPVKIDIKAEGKLDLTESATVATKASCKGAGRVWELFFGKREANNAYHKALTGAQAYKDSQAVLCGEKEFRNGELVPVEAPPTPANLLLQVEQEQEMNNLLGNAKVAYEALEAVPDEEISDEDVDPDFFARWRREAKVIGNEELQNVWGRLLAEEVKKPKSVSYRTLDVVKNMSRSDAELFCSWAKFVAADDCMVCPQDIREDPVLSGRIYAEITRLMDCGLVMTPPGLSKHTSNLIAPILKQSTMALKNHVLVSYDDTPVCVSGTGLTQAGRELYAIAEFEPMKKDDYPVLFHSVRNKNIKLHPLSEAGFYPQIVLHEKMEKVPTEEK